MVIEHAYLDDLRIHKAGGYAVTRMTLGAPAPRAVSDNRPSSHGAVDATAFYGPRSVELTGYVTADSFAEFWPRVDNLMRRLALGSNHVFRFRRLGDDFDLQASVRVDSPVDLPVGDIPKPYAAWGVSLFCPDPRLFASALTSGSYDPTDAGSGGLTFPLEFPLVFGVGVGAGSLVVDHEGTVPTPPVLVAHGPVTNPILDNDTTGLSIYTRDCGLSLGDTLTLDVRERTVVLNGSTHRPDLVDVARTSWWDVAPGANQLRMRGSGMVAGETELSVSFRAARI